MDHNNICTIIIYHFVNVIMNHNNGIGLNILVFIIVKKEINIRQDFILPRCHANYVRPATEIDGQN